MHEPTRPHYADSTITLHHGDCLDVLRSLPDASVDAVVTDPPYGLGFMGREWDALPPGLPWAQECLRVLKPGGHMLAFGGTRTWHRLAVAVEDAGFEIRDSLAWLYGSGFPKSLDVSKAIDKMDAGAERRARNLRFTEWMRSTGVTSRQIDAATSSFMGGHYLTAREQAAVPTADMFDLIRPLFSVDVPEWVEALVRERTVESENYKARAVLATERRANEPSGIVGVGQGQRVMFDRQITAAHTDAARTWQGWGSAMKPAFEPVVVARKPFRGTLAANVLTYGTGALNIDACRINASGQSPEPSTSQGGGRSSRGDSTTCTCPELADDRTSRTTSTPLPASSDASLAGRSDLPANAPQGESDRPRPLGSPVGCQSSPRSGDAPAREAAEDGQASPQPRPDADMSPARCATCGRNRSIQSMPYDHSTTPHVQRGATTTPAGRWPANVILDREMAEALDEQSGELTSGKMLAGTKPKGERETYGQDAAAGYETQRDTPGDSGGASRFFYVAKADASERVRVDGIAHPTVKPLALMRWLVRLVTPSGGTVLEPFAGSGTTVEACLLEGFRCIAIEREADYLPLIVQRVNRRRDPVAAVKGSGGDGGLFDLLGEGA